MLETSIGPRPVETDKISRDNLVDFLSNPANKHIVKMLDMLVENVLFDELRLALRDKKLDDARAIESYMQAVEDVAEWIDKGLAIDLKVDGDKSNLP